MRTVLDVNMYVCKNIYVQSSNGETHMSTSPPPLSTTPSPRPSRNQSTAYHPLTAFNFLHQSLSIHASNSVISIALPAIITKLVCPCGTHV